MTVHDPFNVGADRAMPFLAEALRADTARTVLAKVITNWRGAVSSFELNAIRVTRHKPGRRAVVEYDVSFGFATGAETLTLVGKARAKGLDKRTPGVLAALRKTGFNGANPEGVAVPEPVGSAPQFQMWFQRKVAGTLLAGLLAGKDGPALARRVAEAAHELHRANLPSEREHTIDDELAILRDRYVPLAAERPAWQPRLKRILESCSSLANSLRHRPTTGIHRDFYPAQVLVDGPRLWLLDFDLYCAGDPALDIGNFLGHVTELAVREYGDASALRAVEEMLENRFIELTGESSRAAVRAYQTLTLARHISISAQFPARRPFTEALLELCEQRLGLAG